MPSVNVNPIEKRFHRVKPESGDTNHIIKRADGKFYYPPLDDLIIGMTDEQMRVLVENVHWKEVQLT